MPLLLHSKMNTIQPRNLSALCFILIEFGLDTGLYKSQYALVHAHTHTHMQTHTKNNPLKLDSKNNCREKWELRI